jgi:pyruvate dehydrogenase E1 component
MVDGDFQEISNLDGAGVRKKLVGDDPRVAALLASYTDEQLQKMRRGGHDARKVFTAYERATRSDKPVALIIKTVKGYGMGKAAEGKNKAHQTKNISTESRIETKNRYGIPISDEEAAAAKFWYPGPDDPATKYLHERRNALGGFCPNAPRCTRALNCPN